MKTNEPSVVGTPEKPSPEEVNEIDTKNLLKEAWAYRELGLYTEEEAVLRRVMDHSPAAHARARGPLIDLLVAESRFSEAAALGADAIADGRFTQADIINTMLALNYLGRIKEARETLLLVEECGHPLQEESYQMACFAARLGDFQEALNWLCSEFRRSFEYRARSFTDTDLRPFWSWLRDYTPTLTEAHLMIETPLMEVCAVALDKDAPIEISADDLAYLDGRIRGLFRFEFAAGNFVPIPLAMAREPDAAADFMRKHREGLKMVRDCVVAAQGNALNVVLDAQPDYAAAHAAWGNHFGARYHILWALRHRPALMLDFLTHPGLEMMRPFLAELLLADHEDKTFGSRMQEFHECLATDPDRAWQLLDATPESLRHTALFRLRLACIYHADSDHERALPIWEELRMRWPDDAVGWSNAIAALRELQRPDEARALLKTAPACYRRFRNYWIDLAALEGAPRRFPASPVGAFRGQLDLGGVLIPEVEMIPDDSQSPVLFEVLVVDGKAGRPLRSNHERD